MTLSQTIRETTRKHLLENNGVLLAQCVKAVGWIGGTVPEIYDDDKIIELPTSDVSNGGIVTGFGLANRRPIYVVRYAGFMHYNGISILNYAAKSKTMSNTPCALFLRCCSMETGIGPVATGAYVGPVMRMPGIPVFSPISSKEWLDCWQYFLDHDDPVFCSEHRATYNIDYEMEDIIVPNAKLTIFGISYARVNSLKAAQELGCNFINIVKLKPFEPKPDHIAALKSSGRGLIVDTDLECCGPSRDIAYQLMHLSGVPVYALGLEDRTAGFAPCRDNVTASVEKILEKANECSRNG